MNRNLERLRGFDMFMRSLPLIQQQHPKVRVLIVGDNEPGYGGGERHAAPLRQRMLEELSGQLDIDRIHFLGRVPHPVLMALLQTSWVHAYLSYPFVLGWSLLRRWHVVVALLAVGGCLSKKQSNTTLRGVWSRWVIKMHWRKKYHLLASPDSRARFVLPLEDVLCFMTSG